MKPCTIIVPTFCPDAEVLRHLRRCMDHLFKNTPRELFDLIIVEQGTENANIYYSDLYIQAPKPLGYARAVNIGLKLATTEYVCVLNNDVFLPPNWLETMLADFAKIPNCGVLAPQEGPSESLYTYDAHWWSLILARREVLGLLDEEHLNYRYHDQAKNIDLNQQGYEIVRTGNVIVEHVNSATYSKMNVDEMPERAYMMEKYGVCEFSKYVQRHNKAS